MSARKVHFMGEAGVQRAACGRLILVSDAEAPSWSSELERVTCRRCLDVMETGR